MNIFVIKNKVTYEIEDAATGKLQQFLPLQNDVLG